VDGDYDGGGGEWVGGWMDGWRDGVDGVDGWRVSNANSLNKQPWKPRKAHPRPSVHLTIVNSQQGESINETLL